MLISLSSHLLALIRRNPVVLALILLTVGEVLYVGHSAGRSGKALVYLAVVAVGMVIVECSSLWRKNAPAFPVRRPLRESLFIVVFCVLGYLTMFGRFVWLDWPALPGFAKLAYLPLFGFVFPVFSALLLLKWGYRPKDLGFRWCASAWVFVVILLLIAGTAFLLAPADLMVLQAYAEFGLVGMFITGFISAALSEEFLRMTLQTRLGALWNNGIAWYIAAVLWAFLHMPKALGDGVSLGTNVLGCVYIVPIGLLWGYMTHRTRSIWPSVICHGLNLWGLQNI